MSTKKKSLSTSFKFFSELDPALKCIEQKPCYESVEKKNYHGQSNFEIRFTFMTYVSNKIALFFPSVTNW